MTPTHDDLLLVTGATGLVGSHVAERLAAEGRRTRAIVRSTADDAFLRQCGVEIVAGDLSDADSLRHAVEGATVVVHCAAKVGDWGPVEDYREVNVRGLERLLAAAEANGRLRRFVHISSLGVYEARDHYGTDETEPPCTRGIDGYTLTKVEAEQVVQRHVAERRLPAVVLRPGFVYGPRDRTVLPRLLARLKSGGVKFLGSGEQLMNNTFVRNLVDAVMSAIRLASDERFVVNGDARPSATHDSPRTTHHSPLTCNITDGRLVSKREFMTTIAEAAGYPAPTKSVPLGVARALASGMEGLWSLLGKNEAPLLSRARFKFLGLNLDYSIGRARRELGYDPPVDFTEGMRATIEWFRATGRLP